MLGAWVGEWVCSQAQVAMPPKALSTISLNGSNYRRSVRKETVGYRFPPGVYLPRHCEGAAHSSILEPGLIDSVTLGD